MVHQVEYNGQIHEFPDEATPEMMAQALGIGKSQESSPLAEKNNSIWDIIKQKAINSYKTDEPGLISPMHLIKAGLMGMGEAGQNIGELASPLRKYIPEAMKVFPDVNMKKIFNAPENPSVPERAAETAGQYAPLLAAGPMGLLADIATGAAYGATQSPNDRESGSIVGGGSSGAFNLLNKFIGSSNPIIKMAARGLMGGAVGYGLNGPKGAAEGSFAGIALPRIAQKLGMSGEHPGIDIANMAKPSETIERVEAAKRIGTNITPGEAAGRPDITAAEASVGRTGEGASERVKIGQERINQQQNAIKELDKKISSSGGLASFDVRKAAQDSIEQMENARQEAVDPFYKIAYKKKVAPNLIKSLSNSDKNIEMAIDEALTDPKYQVEGELKGFSPNSVKVLDYAKRKLDAKIAQAESFGDKDAVRVLNASKNRLLKAIDTFSPDYAKARSMYNKLSEPIDKVKNSQVGRIAQLKDTSLKNVSQNIFDPSQTDINVLKQIKDHIYNQNPEAWDGIVKNEINRLMTQGRQNGYTGRQFYDKVLSNPNRFKQFQVALEHNPAALSHLNDMKTAWEHIINMETPRTAAGQAKTSMSKARESIQALVDAYNDMIGGEKQIKALNYLYTDKWQKDFRRVTSMAPKERKPMMIMLLGKTIAPAYVLDNRKQQ